MLALTEERDTVAALPWRSVDPEVFGQQSSTVPSITRKRYEALSQALSAEAA